MITAAQWLQVLAHCGVRFTTAVSWAKVFEEHVQPENFSLGASEIDDFCGQVLHETQLLERLEENLNYSAKRMTEVWPSRFLTIASAEPYAFNPEALANKTYGGRLGNTAPGDGWRYRGRGIPMITGRANYLLMQRLTGLPLIERPELLSNPDGAMRCGLLWWEKKIPDGIVGDVSAETKIVQGAQLGLADRKMLTAKAGEALAAYGTNA